MTGTHPPLFDSLFGRRLNQTGPMRCDTGRQLDAGSQRWSPVAVFISYLFHDRQNILPRTHVLWGGKRQPGSRRSGRGRNSGGLCIVQNRANVGRCRRLRFPKSDTVFLRLIENPRASQKVRLDALRSIARPSLSLLCRLLKDPGTPSRLLGLAAERYKTEIFRRGLRLNARTRAKETTAGGS